MKRRGAGFWRGAANTPKVSGSGEEGTGEDGEVEPQEPVYEPVVDEEGNPVYEKDDFGQNILDEDGQPKPKMRLVEVVKKEPEKPKPPPKSW